MGAAWWLINLWSAPQQAIIKPNQPNQGVPPHYGVKTYSGQQISFACDERYSPKTTTASLDSFLFDWPGQPYKHLAVTVDNLPPAGLSEYPAYQTRHLHPEQYQQSATTINGRTFVLFYATDSSEAAAFGVDGGREVAVVLTSGAGDQGLKPELAAILPTLRWR